MSFGISLLAFQSTEAFHGFEDGGGGPSQDQDQSASLI